MAFFPPNLHDDYNGHREDPEHFQHKWNKLIKHATNAYLWEIYRFIGSECLTVACTQKQASQGCRQVQLGRDLTYSWQQIWLKSNRSTCTWTLVREAAVQSREQTYLGFKKNAQWSTITRDRCVTFSTVGIKLKDAVLFGLCMRSHSQHYNKYKPKIYQASLLQTTPRY